jgi:hypothetical protein
VKNLLSPRTNRETKPQTVVIQADDGAMGAMYDSAPADRRCAAIHITHAGDDAVPKYRLGYKRRVSIHVARAGDDRKIAHNVPLENAFSRPRYIILRFCFRLIITRLLRKINPFCWCDRAIA